MHLQTNYIIDTGFCEIFGTLTNKKACLQQDETTFSWILSSCKIKSVKIKFITIEHFYPYMKLFHNVNQSNACQPRLQDGTFECLSGVKREVSLSSLTVGYFGYIECLSAVSRHFVSWRRKRHISKVHFMMFYIFTNKMVLN